MSEEEKTIWQNPRRGFRVMWWDPIAVVVMVAATWFAWDLLGLWSLIAPFVLLNFFLFCNVFRVRQNYELLWGATFIANALFWTNYMFEPLGLMGSQLVVTAAVVVAEMRSEEYRGVFWERLR